MNTIKLWILSLSILIGFSSAVQAKTSSVQGVIIGDGYDPITKKMTTTIMKYYLHTNSGEYINLDINKSKFKHIDTYLHKQVEIQINTHQNASSLEDIKLRVAPIEKSSVQDVKDQPKQATKKQALSPEISESEREEKAEPPKIDKNFNVEEYIKERKKARAFKAKYSTKKTKTGNALFTSASSATPTWESKGPFVGRVTAIVADPDNPDKVYVGTPAGGVWKSTDGGAHFTPIFDHSGGSLSIGSLALDPHDSDIIYVGTGECGTNVKVGDGLWRSSDGGETWEHLGLENAYNLGAIVIDPTDSDRLFVTSYINGEKGIFRSIDGGESWQNIKPDGAERFRSIHMDPNNHHRLYAVSKWRGTTATLWKSEDSGDHWTNIVEGISQHDAYLSFALAPSDPHRLYVSFSRAGKYITYRSDNYGDTWQEMTGKKAASIYGRYCGKTKVSPTDKNRVYILDVSLHLSTDGGENFNSVGPGTHVDHHDLWISPDGETLYQGNDGGVYISKDSGDSYTYRPLPIGQVYSVNTDSVDPHYILTGLQDNGCQFKHDNIAQWHVQSPGDGFSLLSSDNGEYSYCLSPGGRIAIYRNAIQISYIKIPNAPSSTRMIMDPSNTNILYHYVLGFLYAIEMNTNTSTPLLRKVSPLEFDGFMKVDIPLSGHGNTIYVSDRRHVWVSKDRGKTWKSNSLYYDPNYSPRAIVADPKNDAIVYLSSIFPSNKGVLRSIDYGSTWTNITSNLPSNSITDITVDPKYSDTLYCSSGFGVYISTNTGASWRPLGENLPEVHITDLKIVNDGNDAILYAATYGRGVHSLHLNDAQRHSGIDQKPTAPSELNVTDITMTSATLTWKDNSHNENGFKIYEGNTLVETLGRDINHYTLTGLDSGSHYTYSVKAYNLVGESDPTSSTFTTQQEEAAARFISPANNTETEVEKGQTITLRWKMNQSDRNILVINVFAAGHWYYLRNPLEDGHGNDINGTSFTFDIPTGFREGYARLDSYDSDGNHLGNSTVDFFIKETVRPTAPSNLNSTNITANTATLTWEDNSHNENGFKIYEGSTLVASTDSNVESYTLTALHSDSTYTYSVKAFNTKGESGSTVKTFKTRPDVIGISHITSPEENDTVEANKILTLQWEDHGASRHLLNIRARVNGHFQSVKNEYITSDIATFSLPAGFDKATVELSSFDGSVNIGSSIITFYSTSAIPTPPSELNVTDISTNSAILRWKDNSNNETAFHIYSVGSYQLTLIHTVDANVTSVPLTQLANDSNHTFIISAYNTLGKSKDVSITFKTKAISEVSKSIITSHEDNDTVEANKTLTLTWENHGATSDNVYIVASTNDGWEVLLHEYHIPNNNINFILPAGFNEATVELNSYDGSSSLGKHIIHLYPKNAPTPPSNLNATNITKNAATLTWKDNANNESGFKIYRGNTLVITTAANVKTINLTGLSANTSYTYTVKAYNSAGESDGVSVTFETILSGFDFNTCSGSGTFEQEIVHYGGNYENAITVGEIPQGIQGLKINLISDKDVDIRLYADNGDKIVHWPKGILNGAVLATKPYQNVNVTYSGYNGASGEKGHEFIEVEGTTPTAFTMKAFGYRAGYATVNYSWTGKEGCTPTTSGTGTFEQTILNKATNLVGTIPPNVENVEINLTSNNDLDIQLYAQDGTAIARWNPAGLMAGATQQSVTYHDMNITWSGYNGVNNQKGHEYITIEGNTTEMLTMKVYGYQAGSAHVVYKWGD